LWIRSRPQQFNVGQCYFGRGASSVARPYSPRAVSILSRYRVATRSCTRLNKKTMEQPKKGPSSTVQKHRGEPDTRDRHTNLTNTSKPTPSSDSRARPHPNPGTHASPQTTAHHSPDQARCGGDGHTDAWTHPDLVLLCVNRVNVNTTDATTVCERLPRCLFTCTCERAEFLPVLVSALSMSRLPLVSFYR
jgi:hypothetical protein